MTDPIETITSAASDVIREVNKKPHFLMIDGVLYNVDIKELAEKLRKEQCAVL